MMSLVQSILSERRATRLLTVLVLSLSLLVLSGLAVRAADPVVPPDRLNALPERTPGSRGMAYPPPPTATPTSSVYPEPTSFLYLPLIYKMRSAAQCASYIQAGDFEGSTVYLDNYWSRGLTPAQARYTMSKYHSAFQSALLGIKPYETPKYSWSTVYQGFVLPSNAVTATLTFWWQRHSEEPTVTTLKAPEPSSEEGLTLDNLEYWPYDVHEVLLLGSDVYSVVDTLEWGRGNDPNWVKVTHDLMPYVRSWDRTLYLYFNAYNADDVNRTWMYVDDVDIQICTRP